MSLAWSLACVPFLILLNAFFVAAEYAVVSLRPGQMQAMRAARLQRAAGAIEQLQHDPASAIGAIQVCITMTNLLLGWIGEPAMSAVLHRAFGPLIEWSPTVFNSVSIALSFLIVTLLTVVMSELLPKALTLRYAIVAARITAQPMLLVQRAIRPLVWLMNQMANAITLPLGLGRVDELDKEIVTVEELRLLVKQAADAGVLSTPEQRLVVNSLILGEKTARDIMVHRKNVAFLDVRKSMPENREIVNEHLYSRLPVCDGGMDHVIGLISTKAFLAADQADADTSVLQLLVQPPVFVPQGVGADKLLSAFRKGRTEFVFVVDEYGGVEGIVTMRDVIDELLVEPTLQSALPATK